MHCKMGMVETFISSNRVNKKTANSQGLQTGPPQLKSAANAFDGTIITAINGIDYI